MTTSNKVSHCCSIEVTKEEQLKGVCPKCGEVCNFLDPPKKREFHLYSEDPGLHIRKLFNKEKNV